MVVRVAINGPGRIGRTFIWSWARKKRRNATDVEIVAINGVRDVEKDDGIFKFSELVRYDSAYGYQFDAVPYGRDEGGRAWIELFNKKIYLFNNRGELSTLPWNELDVDVVVEATGRFKTRVELEGHIKAGARKVVLSCPGKEGIEVSVVRGVTEKIPAGETIIDCASCTTNGIAPVVKVINDVFGIKHGYIITVHAPTESQRILDGSHKDPRRARSLLNNIIPTTTGAAKAVVKVIPELKGRLDALAFRVPSVLTGSIVGIMAEVEKKTSIDEVNEQLEYAAKNEMKGILACSDEPLVSTQIIGREESCIVDKGLTQVIDGSQVVVWSWYDNEFGYSTRLVEVAEIFGKMWIQGWNGTV